MHNMSVLREVSQQTARRTNRRRLHEAGMGRLHVRRSSVLRLDILAPDGETSCEGGIAMKRLKLSEVTEPGWYTARASSVVWEVRETNAGLRIYYHDRDDCGSCLMRQSLDYEVFGPLPSIERLEAMQELCDAALAWDRKVKAKEYPHVAEVEEFHRVLDALTAMEEEK